MGSGDTGMCEDDAPWFDSIETLLGPTNRVGAPNDNGLEFEVTFGGVEALLLRSKVGAPKVYRTVLSLLRGALSMSEFSEV